LVLPYFWGNTGWSHFAQFTIAVVNKDPKKSKYSGLLVNNWLQFLCLKVFKQCLSYFLFEFSRYITPILEEGA